MKKRIFVGIIGSILITTFPVAAATTSLWAQAIPGEHISSLYVNTVDNSILYGDDLGGKIVKLSVNTQVTSTIAMVNQVGQNNTVYAPAGIAMDNLGNIYYSDAQTHTINKVDMQNGQAAPMVIAGTGAAGYTGDGGSALQATFTSPAGIAIDYLGDIFVADMGNHVIRRIDALTGIITTVAGTGVAGNTGNNGNALSATLNAPYGLAFDNNGFLLITEIGNHTVRTLAGNTIALVAGTGVAGFSGDDNIAAFAQLNSPMAIAVGKDDTIYIADTGNSRVRTLNGGQSFISTFALASSPVGIGVDSNNNVYIADNASQIYIAIADATNSVKGNQVSCFFSTPKDSGFLIIMMTVLFMFTIVKAKHRK